MKDKVYTVAIRTSRPKSTFVFLHVCESDEAVIAYAKNEIHKRNDVVFILLRRGDAKASDPVFWDSRMPGNELSYPAEVGSPQQEFESLADAMGIRQGALAMHANRTKYLNPNVQWMWEQYKRKDH